MRKIVFIGANEYVPWGGSESLWSAAAERFARRGVQVYVSVKDWGKPVEQVEYLRSVGCKIVHRRSASLVDRLSRKLFRDVNLLGSMSGHLEPVQEYFRAVYERYHQAGAGSEALDAERILPEHRLPPEICDSSSGRTSSWKTPERRPRGRLWWLPE
jgi:hypothetical protein